MSNETAGDHSPSFHSSIFGAEYVANDKQTFSQQADNYGDNHSSQETQRKADVNHESSDRVQDQQLDQVISHIQAAILDTFEEGSGPTEISRANEPRRNLQDHGSTVLEEASLKSHTVNIMKNDVDEEQLMADTSTIIGGTTITAVPIDATKPCHLPVPPLPSSNDSSPVLNLPELSMVMHDVFDPQPWIDTITEHREKTIKNFYAITQCLDNINAEMQWMFSEYISRQYDQIEQTLSSNVEEFQRQEKDQERLQTQMVSFLNAMKNAFAVFGASE